MAGWGAIRGLGFCTLLLLVLTVVVPAQAVLMREADDLRLVVSDSLPPPYLIQAGDGTPPKGLAIDLCRKVAERLGHGSVVRLAPPRRLPELVRAGDVDMVCHISAAWYPYPDEMWFGRRLYNADNVFIAARNAAVVCERCALPPDVATVIGYEYGDRLRRAIDSGQVARRDVRTEENVFRLVQHGRVPYGIVSEYTFHYFAQGARELAIKGSVARFNITVAVPRNGIIGETELKVASASIRLPQDVAPEYQPYLGLPGQKEPARSK